MKFLGKRLLIGLIGLGIFWGLGLISTNEFAKSGVLMTAAIIGLSGLFMLGRPRSRTMSAFSAVSVVIYLLFFADAAIKGFLRDYFGLRPNHSLVLQAILNTDTGETQEFFVHNYRGVSQAVVIFLTLVILAIFAERRLRRQEASVPRKATGWRVKTLIAATFSIFVALHFNPTMAKENPVLFWPLRYVEYQAKVANLQSMQDDIARNMVRKEQWKVRYTGEPERTVVLVIGESINRANMSLYGYPRTTTPSLDAIGGDLIVFRDVMSAEATTLGSLMKMLTPADLEQPDLWNKNPDVVALAKHAGYKTFWLSNQYIGDGWIGLTAQQADESVFINKGAGRGENNFDANLLPHFDQALSDKASKKFIIVHMLGAHPTYEMRYPKTFSTFDGARDTISDAMQAADRSVWIQDLRDKYDNAILYNDYVIGSLIRRTAESAISQPAALLFTSDHGQEVGHTRDHAGHSFEDASGYQVPMLLWKSRHEMTEMAGSPGRSLLEARAYQSDDLDHTILGLLKLDSAYSDPTLDIMHSRFNPRQRHLNGVAFGFD
jgi:heptose-I-phosphate ethanolaminephosphotransferase